MNDSGIGSGSLSPNEGWVCQKFGNYQNLKRKPIGGVNPGKGQVIIKNQGFALGFPDLLMVQG